MPRAGLISEPVVVGEKVARELFESGKLVVVVVPVGIQHAAPSKVP